MAVFLAGDFDAVIRGQHLLQSDSHAKPKHGSERAMGDSRGNLNRDLNNCVRTWHAKGRRGSNMNVRKIDDRQLAQGNGVFRIRYVRNQI